MERATGIEPATSSLGRDRMAGTTGSENDGNRSPTRVFVIWSIPGHLWISAVFPPTLPEICQKFSAAHFRHTNAPLHREQRRSTHTTSGTIRFVHKRTIPR